VQVVNSDKDGLRPVLAVHDIFDPESRLFLSGPGSVRPDLSRPISVGASWCARHEQRLSIAARLTAIFTAEIAWVPHRFSLPFSSVLDTVGEKHYSDNWRNIAVTLIDPGRVLKALAS
jgi:hypothetical protein